ncbi:MAG: DUF4373 domain-containing protein [Clostridiales bacterium]|jgi:hypothetical protein|nr:DUF4373 domain-containing protein [Clostridiales bacterium]
MARKGKVGIDYFPFDTDFFGNDKIQLIEGEFGMSGGYIAVRLLCKIYKEGYFYKWGADECLIFKKSLGIEGVSTSLINEVVNGLVRRGFFDKTVFTQFGILTSRGIQNRYFEAVRRYKSVPVFREFLLVDVSKMINVYILALNVDINSLNVDINPQIEIEKEKEKKKEKFKKENFDFSFLENDFEKPFSDWLEYKKGRRETYKTQKSIEMCYEKLKKLSGGSPEIAMEIVKQSMAANYMGLFALKNHSGGAAATPAVPAKKSTLDHVSGVLGDVLTDYRNGDY